MPQRSFRVEIDNSSSWLDLAKTSDYLAHGEWTEGCEPPGLIAHNTSGALASESAGFMTGTEGYVKYAVNGPDGDHGQLYVYWDNPWYGVTHFRFEGAGGDVPPDTDGAPDGGSTFPTSPETLPFRVVARGLRHSEGGGEITAPGDLVHYLVGPASLIGLTGIVKDPVLELELGDAEPTFRDLGPQVVKALTQAGPNDWIRDWRDGDVEIAISARLGNRVAIHVDDHGPNPLQLDTETSVGRDWFAERLQHDSVKSALGPLAGSISAEHDRILTTAVRQIGATSSQSSASATMHRLEHEVAHATASGTDTTHFDPALENSTHAIADLLASSTVRLVLDEGVVLELYGLYQDGARIDERLHYQHMDQHGALFNDRMLSPHYDIR
jgi:hypothetical protein